MPVALLVGGLVAAVGLLRLGWISEFLSTPAVTGVLAGISVQIVVHQLPAVLGVPGGGTTTVGRVRPSPASSAPCTPPPRSSPSRSCWWSCSRSGRTTAFLGRCWGVVGSIVCVPVFGLRQHGVNVLGTVRGGLPSLGVHGASWADLGHLIAPALTVAFVCVVQTAVVERRAAPSAPADDLDRDLVVIGAGSAVAGLCGAFAVNASPPRTEVTRASGGRTQVTGLVAATVVFIVVLVATALPDNLPQATLGAILVVVASRLFRPRELLAVLRFDRLEFAIALIALAVVAVFGIEQGVVVAMFLSLAERTRLSARPRDAMLGREPGTDRWVPTDIGRETEQVPGILVYLLYAPLRYGNAAYVRSRFQNLLGASPQPVRGFVLDANAMSDVDFTGAGVLGDLARELGPRAVTLASPAHHGCCTTT